MMTKKKRSKKAKTTKKRKAVTVIRYLFKQRLFGGSYGHFWATQEPQRKTGRKTVFLESSKNRFTYICKPAHYGLPILKPGQCVRVELTYILPQ